MDHAKDDPAALHSLRRVVRERMPKPDLRRALMSESYVGIAMIRNLHLMKGSDEASSPLDPARLVREGLPAKSKHRAFLARHLDTYSDLEERIQELGSDSRAIARAADEIGKELERRRGMSYILEANLFPVMGEAGKAVVHSQASLLVADTLAAAMMHRLKHGDWPTTLEGSPLDPVDGKALRFHRTADGFRVYSVGKDGKDDGGRTRAAQMKDLHPQSFTSI